jgi:hypothetical protein
MNIILIAKESSGFEHRKELFAGGYSFYDKKRYSYEYYLSGNWRETGFHVVGKNKNSQEIERGMVKIEDLNIVLPDLLEKEDYKRLINLVKEKISSNEIEISKCGEDLKGILNFQILSDENVMLKNILSKLKFYE